MSAYKNIVNLLIGAHLSDQETATINAILQTRKGDKPRRQRRTTTPVAAKKKAAKKVPKKKAQGKVEGFGINEEAA